MLNSIAGPSVVSGRLAQYEKPATAATETMTPVTRSFLMNAIGGFFGFCLGVRRGFAPPRRDFADIFIMSP
jgi:hypothetical protein